MAGLIAILGAWSHAIAAFLFGAMALWQLRLAGTGTRSRVLAAAFALTALWALATAIAGPMSIEARLFESARNLVWLGFMVVLVRGGGGQDPVRALYLVVALVIGGQGAVDLLTAVAGGGLRLAEAFIFASLVLRLTTVIGALVLVHNLYSAAAPDARSGLRTALLALAGMWTLDLNLYTIAYLVHGDTLAPFAIRGVVMVALAPAFALAARQNQRWKMRLSRTVAFQSLSLMAIGGYLVAMVLIVRVIEIVGGGFTQMAQITVVFGMTLTALTMLPSPKLRAWAKVKVAKHFFAHRYDYRTEWLRFTDRLGKPGPDGRPLEERVANAIADLTESPAALLLATGADGALRLRARWNWPTAEVPAMAGSAEFAAGLGASGRILALADAGDGAAASDAVDVPGWMTAEPRAWALVPLIHVDRLIGAVLVARPPYHRTLDWEDFDLLRVAGRQAASSLAEARVEEALSEARRFEEFNRRFAFIMHDIKNLVSGLSLLARNAERHADNPAFRSDMIATLNSSGAKLTELLGRLTPHERPRAEGPQPVALRAIGEALAATKRALHPISVTGDAALCALADPARLEQALGHLIQNAIDASPPDVPVAIAIGGSGDRARVTVADRGDGMTAEFIADGLFRPFTSTKPGGFGVGAFEARTLTLAMGGRLEVDSVPGGGSRFTILLPLAKGARDNQRSERKVA